MQDSTNKNKFIGTYYKKIRSSLEVQTQHVSCVINNSVLVHLVLCCLPLYSNYTLKLIAFCTRRLLAAKTARYRIPRGAHQWYHPAPVGNIKAITMLSLFHNKLNKIIGKTAPPTPKIPILTESTSCWVFEVASMWSPSPPYLKLILSAKQVQENARNTKTMVYMLFYYVEYFVWRLN